jgi:hypothetical protein
MSDEEKPKKTAGERIDDLVVWASDQLKRAEERERSLADQAARMGGHEPRPAEPDHYLAEHELHQMEHERARADAQAEHDRQIKEIRAVVQSIGRNLDALNKQEEYKREHQWDLRVVSDEDLLGEVKRRGLDRLGLKWKDE